MVRVSEQPAIHPLPGGFGVEITGLPVDRQGAVLDDALRRHRLVITRGLELDDEAQLRVASQLGPLSGRRGVPEVRFETNEPGDAPESRRRQVFYNQQWHADLSWTRQGAPVTMLYAVSAEPGSAATAFADMIAAYASLPDSTRSAIASWQAMHHVKRSCQRRYGHPGQPVRPDSPLAEQSSGSCPHPGAGLPTIAPERVDPSGAVHPVVQVDPTSGRPHVHLGDHAWTLAGHDVEDGAALVDELNELAVAAAQVDVHQWRAGDLVLFDNRSVLHRREPGGDDQAVRVLRRSVIWHRPLMEPPTGSR